MELLEREDVQDSLTELLRESQRSGGRLVLLAGEAGVGKTVLLRKFCETIRQGTAVLTGGCDPLSTPRPLEPLFDVAAQLGGELAEALHLGEGRGDAFRALLGALGSRSEPTVLVIEDVHWADESSLDLLRFLARRIEGTRTLLIATYRDDELGPSHPLRVIVGDLVTLPAVRRLSLSPLSKSAVALLAKDSEIDPVELHARTNGNPFFVTEALAAGVTGVPVRVRDAVLARAARLSAAGREALEAAAIVGARAEPWLLMKCSVTAAGVQEAVDAGILQERGDRFTFRHELAREALIEDVPLPRRIELNRRILEVLASNDGDPELLARLAHHADECQDASAVLRYARAAAHRSSSLGSHREAAAQYERALRYATHLDDSRLAELLDAYAGEAGLVDRQAEAIQARRRARALWRQAGVPLKEADSLTELALHCVRAGRNGEAEEASRESLDLLASEPAGRELARAYMRQGYLRMLHRDSAEAVAMCCRVMELPDGVVDEPTLIENYIVMGTAQVMGGEDATGVGNIAEGIRRADSAGLHHLVALAHMQLGSGSGELHMFARADEHLRAAVHVATEHDLEMIRLYALAWLSLTSLHAGRWQEAAEAAMAVVDRPDAAATSRIMALQALGRLRVRRGDPEVWPVLDEALELASATGTLQRIAPVRAARAEAAWFSGDERKTITEVDAALDLALQHRHPWFVGELAYWRWKAGKAAVAPACSARPYALQMAGNWREAAEEWRRLGCPYEEARSLAEGGDDLSLWRALRIFDELGARPAASATARELRLQGARGVPRGPRRRTSANPFNLTPRELQVLEQLHQGKPDKEIASALHLSAKTVGHHVSSILAKMEVRSRYEAVKAGVAVGALRREQGDDKS